MKVINWTRLCIGLAIICFFIAFLEVVVVPTPVLLFPMLAWVFLGIIFYLLHIFLPAAAAP